MIVKITCNTPKGQADKVIEKQKGQLLGNKFSKKMKEQKVVNDSQFYYIIDLGDDYKDYHHLAKRCGMAEQITKTFYKTLISTIKRLNKVGKKFNKSGSWIKKQIVKRLAKKSIGEEQVDALFGEQEFEEQVDFLDEKKIKEFIAGEIIKLEIID